MIGKGIFEFTIEGDRKIGFKFGMYAAAVSEKIAECTIMQLFEKIHKGPDQTMSLLHYFYGGAVAYNESMKITDEITIDKVSDYIESIGLVAAMNVFSESVKSSLPKNTQAPTEKAGQETSA